MDISAGNLAVLILLAGFLPKALGSVPDFSQCDFEDSNVCNFIQDTRDDFDWTRISGPTPSSGTGPSSDHTYETSSLALGSVPDFSQCDFEDSNVCNFIQDTRDDFDWTRISGPTPSSGTGPSSDHTYETSSLGYYLYIEATGQSTNDTARIWTPPYSATNGLCIEWFYHMYGDTVNTLNVYAVDSTGTVGTPVWSKKNNQGNTWILGKVSVTVFGIYKIMFEGIRGSDYKGDISLDDVKITNRACFTQGPGTSQCDFEDPSICNFVQDTMDDFDWTRRSSSTPSSHTGPSSDHTYESLLGSQLNSEIRLVGGRNINEGRVEVTIDGRSGTVCDDSWDINDAHVVCRALGLGKAIEAVSNARFGQGSGNILLDNVGCCGSESSLNDCTNNGIGVHNCNHEEDAGVICTGAGFYMYIEASSQGTNDTARLWTPSYPVTNGLCIEWFYHMYGDTVNTLNVYVVDSTGTVGTPVWTKSNNQENIWKLGKVSVTAFGIYQIMFEGITGSDYRGDIGLDDVTVTNKACLTQAFAKCDFEDPNICNFIQDTMDDFDWTRRSASTPSSYTGPSFDHTYGTSQGYYLYIESSSQRSNNIARVWTSSYPGTNALCIEWFYHMYGDTVNTLNVYIVDSTGIVGAPVWTKTNNQGNNWIPGKVSVITVFGIYQIMFEGIRGSSYTSDIALDDITISKGACLTQVVVSTTQESTTDKATTIVPTTPQSTTGESTAIVPTTPQCRTDESTTIVPTTTQSTTDEPTTIVPTTPQSTKGESTTIVPTPPQFTIDEATTAKSTTQQYTTYTHQLTSMESTPTQSADANKLEGSCDSLLVGISLGIAIGIVLTSSICIILWKARTSFSKYNSTTERTKNETQAKATRGIENEDQARIYMTHIEQTHMHGDSRGFEDLNGNADLSENYENVYMTFAEEMEDM